tara:strand:- start:2302 stop:2724 length:423 start_codon:yes stop_codon:yes gene_type:complete
MPNWTRNELTVQADDPKDLKDFKKKVFTKDEEGKLNFDFEKIIPMPKNIFRGNLGNEEREKYGNNNWYDWSSKNWGTKWNACHTQINFECDEEIELEFDTAWDTPRPIIKKLKKKFPKLRFWGGYIHEGWEDAGSFNEIQ